MNFVLIFAALFAVVVSAAFNETLPVKSVKACAMTDYKLALQNLCGFESIHGLWPDPESACTNCSSEAFSTSKISSSVLNDMNAYWPTCTGSNSNNDFWSHEWSKHGTCTGMSQNDYFAKAISLYKQWKSECGNRNNCYICFTPSFGHQGVCN